MVALERNGLEETPKTTLVNLRGRILGGSSSTLFTHRNLSASPSLFNGHHQKRFLNICRYSYTMGPESHKDV